MNRKSVTFDDQELRAWTVCMYIKAKQAEEAEKQNLKGHLLTYERQI